MTNQALKERAILESIIDLVNAGRTVTFEEDWGGNSLTVIIGDRHTHVGTDGGSIDSLINQLHDLLVEHRGLTWVRGPGG